LGDSVSLPIQRVGVLGDVHGNLLALEAGHSVLRGIGVDRVVCTGDVAAFGPDPEGCVAFLRAHGVATVAGNEDAAVLRPIEVDPEAPPRLRQIQEIMAWSQRRLSPAARAWLAALPDRLELEGGLVCVHAGPGDDTRIVDQGDPKPFPPGARLVCAGHLHRPFVTVDGDRTWANAGSIGRPTDGDPRGSLLVASHGGGRWHVEIVRLELPLDAICDRIAAARMPHAARLCETQRAASWW
jgi:predicted phosphodiesterase